MLRGDYINEFPSMSVYEVKGSRSGVDVSHKSGTCRTKQCCLAKSTFAHVFTDDLWGRDHVGHGG